ncbi:MAG TPA: pilus assembly protein PilM, partial [Solirubrobacteraceae bacterium]|nr:pilus assembly protein PilM [Solirubrobacteraceae bacterium]
VRRPARSGRRAATVTGLEISATQIVAAEARVQDGRIVAERVAARPLSPGLMRDGLVVEPVQLATELRGLFAEHRFSKRVRVGLATPRTVLRVIDLPPLEERDIHAALMMQAQERIPMPLDRAVLDHQTVGLVETSEGHRLRVIVVATEREGIEPLLESLRRAGLRAEGIDLSIFAVIRALSGGVDAERGPVLYAQLGDLVNIAIAEGGVCRFTRQAPQGLAMVLERLAESRAIPVDEALKLVQGAGSRPPGEAWDDDEREVAELLARAAAELGSELRAAAEFYSLQFGGTVTSGVVAGPLATLPGFVIALGAESGLKLVCGEVTPGGPDALGGVDSRLAALASGLAVGELPR